MATTTTFLLAETTPDRFAELTGLVQGRGFVLHGDRNLPGGLYPDAYATTLVARLSEAEVNHYPTGAVSVNQGLRNLGM